MDGASYQHTEFVVEQYQMMLQDIVTIKKHLGFIASFDSGVAKALQDDSIYSDTKL